jgi:hypothetical protein
MRVQSLKRSGHSEGAQMGTTISMPNKKQKDGSDDDEVRVSQTRQPLKRFRVQVDRQVKASFDKEDEATKMASSIKSAHPGVTVSVYDAEKSSSKDFD